MVPALVVPLRLGMMGRARAARGARARRRTPPQPAQMPIPVHGAEVVGTVQAAAVLMLADVGARRLVPDSTHLLAVIPHREPAAAPVIRHRVVFIGEAVGEIGGQGLFPLGGALLQTLRLLRCPDGLVQGNLCALGEELQPIQPVVIVVSGA